MSPGKRQKSETQQAMVQPNTIGFYPFNRLALTALAHHNASVILASPEDPFLTAYKHQQDVVLNKKHTVNLTNRVFNGFSDAFYRGKLPELVVVSADMTRIPEFLESFLDYMEKLCSLGFFSDEDSLDSAEQLDSYIPQIIVASYGIVYSVILQHLQTALDNMGALTPWQRERLSQKLCRGVLTSEPMGYYQQLNEPGMFDHPIQLMLAGNKSLYTLKSTQLLEQFNIAHQFNPNGELGIYEIELQLAYQHCVSTIVPLLKAQGITHPFTEPKVLANWFDECGQVIGMIPGVITNAQLSKAAEPPKNAQLTLLDLAILHQLRSIAYDSGYTAGAETMKGFLDTLKPLAQPVAT